MPRAAAAAVLALLLTPACQIVVVSDTTGPVDGSTSDGGPSSWPTPESSDSSTGEPIKEEGTTGTGGTSTGEGTVDGTTGSTGLDSSSGAETTGGSTSTSNDGSSSSTGVDDDDCGDGIQQPGEACDNGEDNHDENPCTTACKLNLGLVCAEDSECASGVCVNSGFEPDVRRCSIACDPTFAAECYNLGANTGLCTYGGAEQFWCTGHFGPEGEGLQLDNLDDAQPPFLVQRNLFKQQQQAFLIPAQPFAVTIEAVNQVPVNMPDSMWSGVVFDLYASNGSLIVAEQPASMPVVVEPTGVNGFNWVVVRMDNTAKSSVFTIEVKASE